MTFDEQVQKFLGCPPTIHAGAWIGPGVFLVGDVTVGEGASIWPGCSLRGDIAPIRIGAWSNIQDNAVVHVADDLPACIGEWVTVGHQATVHACTIEDEVLIGMGAVILDGARIGTRSIVGANATVPPGTVIPPGSLVLGSPGRVVRTLSLEEQADVRRWAERYVKLSGIYRDRGIGGR
jgi:carbonic anhydrase/acetyltransferase-like protein (isoleucine patch superfamily)